MKELVGKGTSCGAGRRWRTKLVFSFRGLGEDLSNEKALEDDCSIRDLNFD